MKHDYIWLLGQAEQNGPNAFGINVLDFNNDTLKMYERNFPIFFNVCNASMSDTNGNLIFYSNGCRINDASHQVMQNGDMLNPGQFWYGQLCDDTIYGSYNITKGMITLPRPGHPDEYWLFHNAARYGESPFLAYVDKLYYTVVDMSLNNGLGAVTLKNQVILKDTLAAGTLSAVKHANGQDWWIIIAKEPFVDSVYFKVLFTEAGIVQVDTQHIGPITTEQASAAGQAQFSPDGSMYGWYSYQTQCALFDFDRSTGQLSNHRQIHVDTSNNHWGSFCFSPGSRYLYVGTTFNLWQFDTWATDIEASKVHIDTFDGYKYNNIPAFFSHMQIAPDCKIYVTTVSSSDVLHVINFPDRPGNECGFVQHQLKLVAINSPSSQPNFPNYRLDTPYPLCDSSIVYVPTGQVARPEGGVRVYPNPAYDYLNFSYSPASGQQHEHVSFRIFDVLGRELHHFEGQPGEITYTLPVWQWPPGVYFLQLLHKGLPVRTESFVVGK
ncbi:MAG: hypothetical protein Kow0027_16890 [Saprospiraceae bacterium]